MCLYSALRSPDRFQTLAPAELTTRKRVAREIFSTQGFPSASVCGKLYLKSRIKGRIKIKLYHSNIIQIDRRVG